MFRLVPYLLVALFAFAPLACAQEGVDLALVLVDDVSGSINDQEFEIQKQGYLAAFSDPKVVAAIQGGALGQILVAYVEFASDFQVRTVLRWTIVKDAASARAFAQAMRDAPRSFRGRTSISAGIDEAMKLLADLPVTADRRVIDVCGDGTNNLGRPVSEARDDAAKHGVVINGLALANESDTPWLYAHTHPPGGLGNYYRENVTVGPGSFVIEINNYESFAEAIKRKLIQEIS
jgi:hypothetical protein